MVDGHSRSRYSRENGFFIWFENKSPERFVKMKDATTNPTGKNHGPMALRAPLICMLENIFFSEESKGGS